MNKIDRNHKSHCTYCTICQQNNELIRIKDDEIRIYKRPTTEVEKLSNEISSKEEELKKMKSLIAEQNNLIENLQKEIEKYVKNNDELESNCKVIQTMKHEIDELRLRVDNRFNVLNVGENKITQDSVKMEFIELRDHIISNTSERIAHKLSHLLVDEKIIRTELKYLAYEALFGEIIQPHVLINVYDKVPIYFEWNDKNSFQIGIAQEISLNNIARNNIIEALVCRFTEQVPESKNNSEVLTELQIYSNKVLKLQIQMLNLRPSLFMYKAKTGEKVDKKRFKIRVAGDSEVVTKPLNPGLICSSGEIIVKAEVSTKILK